MTTRSSNRCWPGYEPVPGKSPHEQGSCRKSAASKTTKRGAATQTRRKKQLDSWQKAHPGAKRSAAQHLGASKDGHATKGPAKKRTARKSPAGKTARKTTASKTAKKTTKRATATGK